MAKAFEVQELKEFKPLEPLEVDRTTQLRVRVVRFNGKVKVDVRKYVTSAKYTGWTQSGVALTIEQFDQLVVQVPEIQARLRAA